MSYDGFDVVGLVQGVLADKNKRIDDLSLGLMMLIHAAERYVESGAGHAPSCADLCNCGYDRLKTLLKEITP